MRHTNHGPSISRALLAGCIVVISACSSTTSAVDERVTETTRALVGTWTFVRACGGLAPTCRSIGQTTEPTEYVFRSDGTVTLVPQQGTSYALGYQIIPGSKDDPRSTLIIGGGPLIDPRPLQVSFSADTLLTLDEGCCDRFAIDYRRVH